MEEAKMWIHSWIKTTCPDIQFHQNATIDWDFLYYFYDGPAIQYTFQKKIKNKQAVYVGSYSFDGVKTSYESIDLTKIIEQTKEKIKTDISSMTKKSNSV
jgi:hypothetical protein